MARLPTIESRVDPGLGNAGFLRAGARPAPQADIASGVQAAAQGLEAYGQAQERIRSRQDTISRARTADSFFETAAEQYRNRLTEGGFRGKEDVLEFRQWLDETVDRTLGGYAGSPDSRTRLAERLLNVRGDLLNQASGAAVTAQRAEIRDVIRKRGGAVAASVVTDPGRLPEAWAELDSIIDDVADALSPEEEIEERARYRSEVAAGAVEGMLAMGDTQGAMEILTIPGVAETLPPAQQSAFARQITTLRREEERRGMERRQRLEDAAFALGTTVDQLPTWARVQAVGLQLPSQPKAQSTAGKLIEDRQLFIAQYGENSPQVQAFDQMAQSGGEPPSLSDTAGIRKEFTALAKDFVQVRDAYARVETAASSPSAAGDLALIFNFMKILDPGSVVREGEFATAQNSAGVPARVRNLYNQTISGERLSPPQRQDFLGQARGLYQAQLQGHRRLEQQFSGIAQRAGVRPEEVIVDFVGETAGADGAAVPPETAPALGGTGTPAAARGPGGAPVRIVYDLEGNPIGPAAGDGTGGDEPDESEADGAADPVNRRRAARGQD